MATVKIPIMSCPECGLTFNVQQWRALDMDDDQPSRPTLERRICSQCCTVLATNPQDLDNMDAEMDANQYAALWPHSELPALAFAAEAEQLAKAARKRWAVAALVAAVVAAAGAGVLGYIL